MCTAEINEIETYIIDCAENCFFPGRYVNTWQHLRSDLSRNIRFDIGIQNLPSTICYSYAFEAS